MGRPKKDFWSRVEKDPGDGCWLWTGPVNRFGYGNVTGRLAHRIAWWLTRGPIPEGMCVLHRCDNPPCCNPEHLWLGTNADNVADRHTKGRTRWGSSPGEKSGTAKLTELQVREIPRRLATGESQRTIARSYGVTQPAISLIKSGRNWRHVTAP